MDKSETEQDSQMHKNQMQKKNALPENFENCIKNEKNSVNAGGFGNAGNSGNVRTARKIRVLAPEVARKIAAGEVIDRPNAIVRELMDNAVDSGASSITVEINGGGIDCIRVIDNGSGISRDDLKECARPHATSKIQSETDLLHLTTLGFRGEALASIAAVSRLTITSGNYRLKASVTEDHIIEEVQGVEGTIVQSQALFENFPARRVFLKRPASEMLMCRNTFIEKALPKPETAFRLNVDGEMRLNLKAGQTLAKRFTEANSIRESENLFYEIKGSGSDFSFTLVIGEPSVRRSDKKLIFIYVNGRRITEYSLVQAIEYGCQGFFPNGTHPVAALFVQMNSESVDFNIHPAKKEARFQDISELHHAVSSNTREFFRKYTQMSIRSGLNSENSQLYFGGETECTTDENTGTAWAGTSGSSDSYGSSGSYGSSDELNLQKGMNSASFSERGSAFADLRSRFFSPSYTSSRAVKGHPFEKTPEARAEYSISNQNSKMLAMAAMQAADSSFPKSENEESASENSAGNSTENAGSPVKYFGTTAGVFLLAEKDSTLYIIDQHAAHERILYDEIMNSQGKRQALLLPYIIETESIKDDEYLESISSSLDSAGFSIKNCSNGRWEVSTVPERWKGSERDLVNAILGKRLDSMEIISNLAAMTACKAAVKDGYVLDSFSAQNLARQALNLTDPHCPHGRPVYAAITKAQLFALVRRTEN